MRRDDISLVLEEPDLRMKESILHQGHLDLDPALPEQPRQALQRMELKQVLCDGQLFENPVRYVFRRFQTVLYGRLVFGP